LYRVSFVSTPLLVKKELEIREQKEVQRKKTEIERSKRKVKEEERGYIAVCSQKI